MIRMMKTLFYLVIFVGMVACSGGHTKKPLPIDAISIIPKPVSLKEGGSAFELSPESKIYYTDSSLVFSAQYLKDIVKKIYTLDLEVVSGDASLEKENNIVLSLDDEIAEKEGYKLSIDNGVLIAGKNKSGVLFGVQSLYQIINSCSATNSALPGLVIDDYPGFSWRGMHLDVSRHFFDTAFVKEYIDLLALHKMNTFHWHLVDDQGWRIEIKKYPKLTEVGAWRVDREDLPWNERPKQKPGEKATYGGFYTQEEIKDIVAYAAERNIVIVPEIEMPAHASAAIAAYPEYSCTGKPITVPPGGVWPITDIYCAGNDETFAFLEDVLDEVMALFPSKFIHIGGDEATKTEWEKCPKCQKRIAEEGLKDTKELQSYFIKRIDKYLNAKGKRLIGWDEILEGGLAENAAVMSWRGEQGGIEAAQMNHDVVMTPVSYCYLDYYQSIDKEIEPLAFNGYISLEKVYGYSPVPKELDASLSKHILGAQGNVWTEYIPTGEHVEYMAVPRMTALSEVLWSPKEGKDFADFQSRLENFLNILTANDINYFVPAPENLLSEQIFVDSLTIELKKPWPFGKIYYTLDGTEPTASSTAYTEPVTITEEGEIKAIFVLENGRHSQIKSGVFKKATLQDAVEIKGEMVPGMNYAYYKGSLRNLDGLKTLKKDEFGVLKNVRIPGEIKENTHFALEFNGFIKIEKPGVYTFDLISDDGSMMYIDGEVAVDADGQHGAIPRTDQVALKEGFHTFTVQYFEAGGQRELKIMMKGPGMEKQVLPASILFHSAKGE